MTSRTSEHRIQDVAFCPTGDGPRSAAQTWLPTTEAQPYIRNIRNPFEQMVADVQVAQSVQKKLQLAVHEFREAEHLDLTVQRSAPRGATE